MSLGGPTTKRGAETAAYHRAYYRANRERCLAESRKRYKANRETVAVKSKIRRQLMSPEERARRHAVAQESRRLREFGLPKGQYAAMLASQGGACALCGERASGLTKSGRPIALHVDHDHATGRIRGLLCGKCNRAIGYLRDDPALIRKAALYVEAHHAHSRSA